VILYCANTTALHMPDWKYSEEGLSVKLGSKMGRCMKKVENHWDKPTPLETLKLGAGFHYGQQTTNRL